MTKQRRPCFLKKPRQGRFVNSIARGAALRGRDGGIVGARNGRCAGLATADSPQAAQSPEIKKQERLFPKPIDSLSYFYQGGNQLTKVNDSGTVQGFGKGSGTGAAYTYDSLGNLNKDANKGIDSIKYNVLGKPLRIKFSNGNVVTYLYDASGTKLAMVNLPAGAAQAKTDYVGGFVYTNASLTFFSSPEGRVVVTPLSPGEGAGVRYEYQYSIADHLGNPRVVFTSATQTAQTVTATFEDAAQATEAQSFNNYPSGARINPVASNNHTTGGSRSLVLTGGLNSQVGVAKSYQVYAGDKLAIGAWARYDAPTGTGSNLTGFAASLLGAYGLAAPAAGEVGTPRAGLNSWGSLEAGGFGSGSKDNTNPKAFVNILLFDQNFNLVDVAYSQVKSSGAPTSISASYTVKKAGYAFVYVSNESAKQTNVYFDDVAVSYMPTSVVQYNEYYPYGLQTSNSWTRAGTTNNFLANGGTELNPVTQVYDLDFRNYDPALGRLNQVDPMADSYGSLSPYHYSYNNPVSYNDPTGADPRWGLFTRDEWNNSGGYFDQIRNIGGGGSTTGSDISWTSNFNSARIWSPWGGDHLYTRNNIQYFSGAWINLYSFEGQGLFQNKYGADSRVVIDWGDNLLSGFTNGFMFNSIKASLWREFYTDKFSRLYGLPEREGRFLRSLYISQVRSNTPQPMLSWVRDMKTDGAPARAGARFWVTNQNVNINLRGLGIGSSVGLAITTVPRIYDSYQKEGLGGAADETSTILGGIMGAATAMELVAPYALATANPWTASAIFITAGIVGGFAGEQTVREFLSVIK